MSIFTTSTGTILAVPLLDSSGNALEYVADAPGFYKLSGEDIDTLDFYLDYDGTRYMEILTSGYRDWETDRKSTRLNSSHITRSRMPASA